MLENPLDQYCEIAKQLALQAGQSIMQYYADPGRANSQLKADHTPVTAADLAAHNIIVEGLQNTYPDIPILSEEAPAFDYATRQRWQRYWLVDPLDGTREFLKGSGEFTVNIALVEGHTPVVGVVYSPVYEQLYFACRNQRAFLQFGSTVTPLMTSSANVTQLRLAKSRSHGQKNLEKMLCLLQDYNSIPMGSSLKTCLVAAGEADVYPRFGATSEWDTAASHCILAAAGGNIIDVCGRELRYNTKASLLNPWFLAVGDLTIDWLALVPNEFKI